MPYRDKKRTPAPSDQMARMYLDEIIRYSGNLDSLRKGQQITRREAEAKLWLVIASVLLMLWRFTIDLIIRQGKVETELAALRKPVQSETRTTTNPAPRVKAAGSGGFTA